MLDVYTNIDYRSNKRGYQHYPTICHFAKWVNDQVDPSDDDVVICCRPTSGIVLATGLLQYGRYSLCNTEKHKYNYDRSCIIVDDHVEEGHYLNNVLREMKYDAMPDKSKLLGIFVISSKLTDITDHELPITAWDYL